MLNLLDNSQSAKARKRFEKDNLEVKQLILKGIGSNLLLSDQKLEIYPRTPFVKIKDHLDRIVPNKIPVFSDKSDRLSQQNLHWGELVDDVRTLYMSLRDNGNITMLMYYL